MKKLIFLLLLSPVINTSLVTIAAENPKSTENILTIQTADIPKKYAGTYQLNENFQVIISVENNKLYALAPGDQEKSEFTPISNTKFSMSGQGPEIEFIEENGKQYLLVKMQEVMKLIKIS